MINTFQAGFDKKVFRKLIMESAEANSKVTIQINILTWKEDYKEIWTEKIAYFFTSTSQRIIIFSDIKSWDKVSLNNHWRLFQNLDPLRLEHMALAFFLLFTGVGLSALGMV
jgi:hypothetical protein